MAGNADSIRGDGLFRAHRALATLEQEPQRLEHARGRFDESPPPYTSDQSGTTTRTQSPNPPTDGQRRLQLSELYEASTPSNQLRRQTIEEEKTAPIGVEYSVHCYNTVRKRWEDQKIWNKKWGKFAAGTVWKHERPLEPVSESETDPDVSQPPSPGLFDPPREKRRRKKNAEKLRRDIETRPREHEASRPYHQFLYQLSMEQHRLLDKLNLTDKSYPNDINTIAYQNVKDKWMRWHIWEEEWGIIPGMIWRHEKSWTEYLAKHGMQPETKYNTGHHSESRFQAHIPNEHSLVLAPLPPSPKSSQPRTKTTTTRAALSNRNNVDERQLSRGASLDPIHTSRVSKPKRRKRPIRQQQGERSRESSPNETILLSGQDNAAASPPRRRSTRLQNAKPILNGDVPSLNEDVHKAVAQPRVKRKAANKLPAKAPAKPQGVSKTRSTKKASARGRKLVS